MTNLSGNKYIRKIKGAVGDDTIDVYSVLATFDVTCPATQHAIKKLLCAGLRGKGDKLQDLTEALDAVARAVSLCREETYSTNTDQVFGGGS